MAVNPLINKRPSASKERHEQFDMPKRDDYLYPKDNKYLPTSHKKDVFSPAIPRKSDYVPIASKGSLYPARFPQKKGQYELAPASEYSSVVPQKDDYGSLVPKREETDSKKDEYMGSYKREDYGGTEKKGYNDYKYGVYSKNEPKYGVYRADKYGAYADRSRYGVYQKKEPGDKYTTLADVTKRKDEFKPDDRYVPYGDPRNYEHSTKERLETGVKNPGEISYDIGKLLKTDKGYSDPKKEIDKYQMQVDEYNKFLEEVKISKENKELSAKKEEDKLSGLGSPEESLVSAKKGHILDDLKDIEFENLEKLNIVDEYINKTKSIYSDPDYGNLINKESYEKYVKKYENLYDDAIFDDILDTYGNEEPAKPAEIKDPVKSDIADVREEKSKPLLVRDTYSSKSPRNKVNIEELLAANPLKAEVPKGDSSFRAAEVPKVSKYSEDTLNSKGLLCSIEYPYYNIGTKDPVKADEANKTRSSLQSLLRRSPICCHER